MKDVYKSITENIKDRLHGPFGGTFILSWIAYNWKLPFAFFNFDHNQTLDFKINYIQEYLKNTNYWYLLIFPALSALGAIVFYNFFSLLGILIKEIYEKYGKIGINRLLKNAKYVLKSEYIILNKNHEDLLNEYDLKNTSFNKLQNDFNKLKIEKDQYESSYPVLRIQNDELIDNNKAILKKLDNLIYSSENNNNSLLDWEYKGNWQLFANKRLKITNSYDGGLLKIGYDWKDIDISIDFMIINSNFGVIIRATDINNYYMVQIATDTINYLKKQDGNFVTQITNSNNISIKPNDLTNLKIEIRDDLLNIYINNQLIANKANFFSIPNGRFGFRASDLEEVDIHTIKISNGTDK